MKLASCYRLVNSLALRHWAAHRCTSARMLAIVAKEPRGEILRADRDSGQCWN